MTSVVGVKPDQLDSLKQKIFSLTSVTELPTTNRYEKFRLNLRGETIIAYTSGKVVAQGVSAQRILSEAASRLPTSETSGITIGSDEAGKGEWLGPLVVAAVALDKSSSSFLLSEGVMDSKEMSTERIRNVSRPIKKRAIAFRLETLPPDKFNEVMAARKRHGEGLNHILAEAHSNAIRKTIEQLKTSSARIVVDQFDKKKMETQLSKSIDLKKFQLFQFPKAEKEEVAVAAASILARNEREEWIDAKSLELGLDLRALTEKAALKHPMRTSFAKVGYLE